MFSQKNESVERVIPELRKERELSAEDRGCDGYSRELIATLAWELQYRWWIHEISFRK